MKIQTSASPRSLNTKTSLMNDKAKGANETIRCPFCTGKKKQDYKYNDLLQHATGVGKGSANRSDRQKATHAALAKCLENELGRKAEKSPACGYTSTCPQNFEHNDLYSFP